MPEPSNKTQYGWKPDRINIGASVRQVSLDAVATTFGMTGAEAETLCRALKVPLVAFPGSPKRYINLYAIETALFEIGMPPQIRNDPALLRVHQELAGAMYGATTRAILMRRIRGLANQLKKSLTPSKK